MKEINNNIEEPKVNLEIAKLLKEKGFHWDNQHPLLQNKIKGVPTQNNYYSCYNSEGSVITPKFYNFENPHYPRPTHALTIQWIRENFGIYINAFPIYINKAIGLSEIIGYSFHANRDFLQYEFDTFEEAESKAILYTLKNLV